MQKSVVVDLLNEEIRHIRARDEPARPVAWIDQRGLAVRLRPSGQDYGPPDPQVELAPADYSFLRVLVVIAASPAMAAAFARPEACHADQPLDVSLLHHGDEHPRRFGEK